MQGFSEQGAPAEWDMAVGSVRGYRWWILTLPFVQNNVMGGDYGGFMRGLRTYDSLELLPPCARWVPAFQRAQVSGFHSGIWDKRNSWNGLYTATCHGTGKLIMNQVVGNRVIEESGILHQAVPEPNCGCGFWAYWHRLSSDWDACFPQIIANGVHGIEVSVPLGGVIEGTGRTIIGERGFRCEKARITDLSPRIASPCRDLDMRALDDLYSPVQMIWTAGNTTPTPVYVAEPVPEPNHYTDFMSRLEYRAELPQSTLQACFKVAVASKLGTDFNWYSGIDELQDKCKPDENYGY